MKETPEFEKSGMRIITLTLSPAFDMHCHGGLALGHESLVHLDMCQAGGKGVNISRALASNGCENLALLVLGEENAHGFLRNLEADRVDNIPILTPGRIRENITIHTPDGGETRISFPGFSVKPELLDKVSEVLLQVVDRRSVVTMTGRVPDGMSLEGVKTMLGQAAELGAKIVVDSRSFSLADLVELKPWLIKPNQEEISAYLGREVSSLGEICQEAMALHGQGIVNVMISMGCEGALLACGEGVFLATPPKVEVLSTIGAGDSTIAGFLAAEKEGCSAPEKLVRGVAFGTAACMTPGTEPPRPEDVTVLCGQIRAEHWIG